MVKRYQQTDIAGLREAIAPVLGQETWGARLGFGSFLTFEFGRDVGGGTRKVGEWHFWIQYCAWRISSQDQLLGASGDDQDQALRDAVASLNGKIFQKVSIGEDGRSTSFHFGPDIVLETFACYSSDLDHWWAFMPTGDVAHLHNDGSWSIGPKTATRKSR
jgi:hypothetical protein